MLRLVLAPVWTIVTEAAFTAISLAMLYVNVLVSHVYDSTRVTLRRSF